MSVYFAGFCDLTAERFSNGYGGQSAITYTSKAEWLDRNVTPELFGLGMFCLNVLDREYLAWGAEQAKKEKKKAEQKVGRGSRRLSRVR